MYILINGFNGNMGQAIQAQCKKEPDIKVQNLQSKEINLNGVSVVIDFSSPDGFVTSLNFCVDHKLPLITGTTGLKEDHLKLVSTAKKSIPVLIASNMSLGIANLKNSIENYLTSLNSASKCKVVEIHHKNKKDSPSGTALEILRFLEKLHSNKIDGSIEIQSQRIGNIFGIHRVEFEDEYGITSFQHIANSRNVFAIGALQAARWISSKKTGKFNFDDFLNKKL